MTKIEKATQMEKDSILKNHCPMDYRLKDKDNCTYKKTGCIDDNECFQCWYSEVEEITEKVRMIIDYIPAVECKNEEAWYTCYKCGKCGRKFVDGILVDDGGTHIDDEEEEEDD